MQYINDDFSLYNADCVEAIAAMPDNSIHYTVTSPPFSSLYTYSASERDMGNCDDDAQFYQHFRFLVEQLYRVTKPGRLISLHCMNLPSTIQHNGYIGIRDFRGDLIRIMCNSEEQEFLSAIARLEYRQFLANQNNDLIRMQKLQRMIDDMTEELRSHPLENGFYFHSEVTIWKDPVTAMQRTKAIGLLHKQLVKDSSLSRQGIPDYLITFRKPGKNESAIAGTLDYYIGDNPPSMNGSDRDSINIWQQYASPVWMDINPSDTLQYTTARETDQERHVCPLQLGVIERGIQLWSNPGDVVLDPFTGIGSTGWVAIQRSRKFVGTELKTSYYDVALKNLKSVSEVKQLTLI